MKVCNEASRQTPVAGQSDVLVCGGGPAGVAAAIASGRTGAKTYLLETHGCLGGIMTSGGLSWILDCDNKPGIMQEIKRRLEQRGAGSIARGRHFISDPEEMKLLLEEMCLEAGVQFQLHTRVVGAQKDETGRLAYVITESKSGRQAWKANMFIDATGDGDLGALAGCSFDYGRPGTGEMQPMSMLALVTGVNPEEIEPFINTLEYKAGLPTPKQRLLEEMKRAGVLPTYEAPSLFHIRDDRYILMSNHEYGYSGLDAARITEATVDARRELHHTINALRALGGPWRNLRIAATSAQIGVRESRRICGLYRVTEEDIIQGVRHEDAVCHVTFPFDVHSTSPEQGKVVEKRVRKASPYDIPLRALISSEVKGLMMAGRCISGDFAAHSSYRVTGDAVAIGQGAGSAAALAALTDRAPQDIPFNEVRQAIENLNQVEPQSKVE